MQAISLACHCRRNGSSLSQAGCRSSRSNQRFLTMESSGTLKGTLSKRKASRRSGPSVTEIRCKILKTIPPNKPCPYPAFMPGSATRPICPFPPTCQSRSRDSCISGTARRRPVNGPDHDHESRPARTWRKRQADLPPAAEMPVNGHADGQPRPERQWGAGGVSGGRHTECACYFPAPEPATGQRLLSILSYKV